MGDRRTLRAVLNKGSRNTLNTILNNIKPKHRKYYKDRFNKLLTTGTIVVPDTNIIGQEFLLFLKKKGIVTII